MSIQYQLYANRAVVMVTNGRTAACVMAAALLLAAFSTQSLARATYELQSVNQDGVKVRLEVNTLPATELDHLEMLTFLDPLNPEATFTATVADMSGDFLIDVGGWLVADTGQGGVNVISFDFTDGVLPPYWVEVPPDWGGLNGGSIETGSGPDEIRNAWVGGIGSNVDLGRWRLVPEPSTHLLLTTAIVSGVGVRRRRRRTRHV